MRTHKFYNDKDVLFAFEIENIYISVKRIKKLLESINSVENISSGRNVAVADVRIKFEYCGDQFIVMEPFGDNSRFWIGAEENSKSFDVSAIERVFSNYKPPVFIRLLGNLVSLNFKDS